MKLQSQSIRKVSELLSSIFIIFYGYTIIKEVDEYQNLKRLPKRIK